MLGDEALELADQLPVTAEGEIRVDAVLERRHPQLLKPHDLRLRERFPGEIGERCPAPKREGRAQRLRRTRRIPGLERRSSLLAEPDELEQVDRLGLDDEPVAGRRGLECALGQELSEL
jgi:hypothetical protein